MISPDFSQKLGRETTPGTLQQMKEMYCHPGQKSILLYFYKKSVLLYFYYIYFYGK